MRYLEIGSFEGGSLAFVHTLLGGKLQATAVDPFENYDGLPTTDMSVVEARFLANVRAIGADARVLRGRSFVRLAELLLAKEQFDLIYVDGYHLGFDVMTDGVLGWRLLAPRGLMIFDDYPHPDCKDAIDAFVGLIRRDAMLVDVASQVFLRRKA